MAGADSHVSVTYVSLSTCLWDSSSAPGLAHPANRKGTAVSSAWTETLGTGPQAGVSVATQEGPGPQQPNAAAAFHMAEQKHSALKEQTLAPGRGAQHWLRYGCRNTLLALSTTVPALGEHKACTQHHKALRPGDQGFLKVIKTRHIQ